MCRLWMSSTAVVAGEQLWVKQPISTLPIQVLSDNYLERNASKFWARAEQSRRCGPHVLGPQFQRRIRRHVPACRLLPVRNLLRARGRNHQPVIRAVFKAWHPQRNACGITAPLS